MLLSNTAACFKFICCIHSYEDQTYSFWGKDFQETSLLIDISALWGRWGLRTSSSGCCWEQSTLKICFGHITTSAESSPLPPSLRSLFSLALPSSSEDPQPCLLNQKGSPSCPASLPGLTQVSLCYYQLQSSRHCHLPCPCRDRQHGYMYHE